MFAVRSRYIENPQAWQATPGTTFFQKRLDQGQYYASKDFKDGTGLSSACTTQSSRFGYQNVLLNLQISCNMPD
jgi:hypothetical protein